MKRNPLDYTRYAEAMREITLKRFFLREISAEDLAVDVSNSVVHSSSVDSSVQIEDMDEEFALHRDHVIRLCDAASSKILAPESLTAIAFALMASDAFYWDDEMISEVIADWAAPEINYPLTAETLVMHRDWLTGVAMPPQRPTLSADSPRGRLISRTTKTRISRG